MPASKSLSKVRARFDDRSIVEPGLHPEGEVRTIPPGYWVAVKKLKLSYHNMDK